MRVPRFIEQLRALLSDERVQTILRHARRVVEWTRRILLVLGLFYAIHYFTGKLEPHYPIREWLVFRYAGYWGACAMFVGACLSAGHRVLRLIGGRPYEGLREQLITSFALGVLLFFTCVFLLGLAGLLVRPVFYALPAAFVLVGGRPALRLARRCARAVRLAGRMRRRSRTVLETVLELGVLIFGVTSLLLIYGSILSPENASFDARWYHLAQAEQYTIEHTIRRFPEGWYLGAFPQLASVLYMWAFLYPGRLFDKVGACAHLEFTILLATLLGVAVLARRLMPGRPPRFAWVAMFLFPGLFLYDSSLACGADHIAAFWGPPLFLAWLRAWSRPSPRSWFLVAAFAAGACLTKYTAATLAIFPVLALGARCVWEVPRSVFARRIDLGFWRSAATGAVTGIVLTAPHWLKNWLWYGNPVYPRLAAYFHNRPWSQEAARIRELIDLSEWTPQGTTKEKVIETLKALYTFSFEPHDFPKFHGEVPVFGSLFTLSLLALPFLRRTRRLWVLVVAAHTGVFLWYWTQHEDRYLQTLVPWMAAVVTCTMALAWRTHIVAKIGVAGLIGLQIAWGGDVPFLPAHAMLQKNPFDATVRLLSSGHKKNYRQRFDVFREGVDIGRHLPRGAHVLLHEYNPRLGINRAVATDAPVFNGGLHWTVMNSPHEAYLTLRAMGVTHIAWRRQRSRGTHSVGGDLLFFDLIARHIRDVKSGGQFEIGTLADAPDQPELGDDVLFLGCDTSYAPGVYRRQDMNVPTIRWFPRSAFPKPRTAVATAPEAASLVGTVRYVIHEKKCFPELPAAVTRDFLMMSLRSRADLWVRKSASQVERPASAKGINPAPLPDVDAPDDTAEPAGEP